MAHSTIIAAIQSDELDQFETNELIEILQAADDLYYNDNESFLEDFMYDALRRYTEQVAPHHEYFTGIGADVRGGKVKLPYPLGSLDQVHEGEIKGWISDNNLQDEDTVITDKLDGTSAMVIYDTKGDIQIAYSRGNGVEGADITRHVRRISSVPKTVGRPLVTRGEMIISKENFEYLKTIIRNRAGNPYKNARNMIAGIMNAKTNPDVVYDYIDFIAYDVINDKEVRSKTDQLTFLFNKGFTTPFWITWTGAVLSDSSLSVHLTMRRRTTKYDIDGVVIDVDAVEKRQAMNPTRATLNPAYSVKYKVADAANLAQTKVIRVDWNLSKHGYWKPRIHFEPVELCGATITNCTGFNAEFIYKNKISEGAIIEITRSGDVIPFCRQVIKSADHWQEPEGEWEWSEKGVDAIAVDSHNHDTVRVNRMIDFFTAIDAPHLKKGNVQKFFDAGYDTIESIIKATEQEMVSIIGENGRKVFNGLRTKLTDIPLYKLMGAYSNERGIGVRRMKMLHDAFGQDALPLLHHEYMERRIIEVERFDQKTATKVVNAVALFNVFYEKVKDFVTLASHNDANTSDTMSNEKVVFTGFRDKDLQEQVENAGGTMQSSVSNKTTIVVTTNPDSNTGKIKKARDLGIKIVGVDEFKELLG